MSDTNDKHYTVESIAMLKAGLSEINSVRP